MSKKIHLAIAEDHDLVREGLISLLNRDEAITVLFEAANGKELMEKLKLNKPDIVLLDIEMPIMSGVEALDLIVKEYPTIKCIIISSYYSKPFVVKYIEKGAKAYLPKQCGVAKLLLAIHEVHNHGEFFDEEVLLMLSDEAPDFVIKNRQNAAPKFTSIELSIIGKICEGKLNKEIADDMNLSVRTIEWYRSKIFKNIGGKSVQALVMYAIKHNLIKQK
jgi:DNA-binding NarL/FixJ family response regulator